MFNEKEYQKKYQQEHREQILAQKKEYYEAHKKEIKECAKEWIKNNREKHRMFCKNWKIANPDKVKAENERWALANPDKMKAKRKKYDHTLKGIINKRKGDAHYRGLGFVLLNEYFSGGECHHIDKERVVFIPQKLHEANWHRPKQGIGMEKINAAAYQFLSELKDRHRTDGKREI